MSRPKPVIILTYTDTKTYKAEQVLRADAVYAVFFDGQPINLRSRHTLIDDNPKYKKSSYGNPGHAFNLADKLNALFKTDKFEVHRLCKGERVVERASDTGEDDEAA